MLQSSTLQSGRHTFSSRQAMTWYAVIAGNAVLLDLATKQAAVSALSGQTWLYGKHFALMLVYNQGGAGGISWGPYTWLINVAVTALAVLMISMIVSHLARVDRRAAFALGLVAGGATGNLVSMLTGANGVEDFLALRFAERAMVCNVADIALWTGALLLIPIVGSLMQAIRAERAARSPLTTPGLAKA